MSNYKYSREPFDGYKFRAKVKIELSSRQDDYSTDVYTDNPDRLAASTELEKKVTVPFIWFGIIHWESKEQGERAAEFIKDFLK